MLNQQQHVNYQETHKNQLEKSIQKINSIIKDISEGKNFNNEKPLELTIIFILVEKDEQQGNQWIKIQGIPNTKFPLLSTFFNRQSFLNNYFATDICFNLEDFFFYLEEKTRISPLHYSVKHFQSISSKNLGDLRNPVHNLDLKGLYKNHCVKVEDLVGVSFPYNFPLQGIVSKILVWKNTLAVKVIDFSNLIDSFTIFFNFKDTEQFEEFSQRLHVNQFLQVKNNILQKLSKQNEIQFCLNYDKTCEIYLKENNDFDFKNLNTEQRISMNSNNIDFPLTHLVDLLPYVAHRGVHKMLVDIQDILHIQLNIKCVTCSQLKKDCCCQEPNLQQIDVFCILLAKEGSINFTLSLKKEKHFLDLLKVSEKEKEFILDFLRKDSQEFVYKMNERIEFGSHKAKIIQKIFQRNHGHGIVYGKFVAKEASPDFQSKNLEKDKKRVYPNGRIKYMENQTRFIFDFKTKAVCCNKASLNKERYLLYQNYI